MTLHKLPGMYVSIHVLCRKCMYYTYFQFYSLSLTDVIPSELVINFNTKFKFTKIITE